MAHKFFEGSLLIVALFLVSLHFRPSSSLFALYALFSRVKIERLIIWGAVVRHRRVGKGKQ
jgi:hypothetical protein